MTYMSFDRDLLPFNINRIDKHWTRHIRIVAANDLELTIAFSSKNSRDAVFAVMSRAKSFVFEKLMTTKLLCPGVLLIDNYFHREFAKMTKIAIKNDDAINLI